MADPDPGPEAADDTVPADDGESGGTPRWVKVFGAVTLAVILRFVVLKVVGGGEHGPGRHGGGDDETPSSVTEHTPPEGGHAP